MTSRSAFWPTKCEAASNWLIIESAAENAVLFMSDELPEYRRDMGCLGSWRETFHRLSTIADPGEASDLPGPV